MSYFDLQVNGYAGADFNQGFLSAADLRVACEQLASDGVEQFLATIIIDTEDRMLRRIRQLVELAKAMSMPQAVFNLAEHVDLENETIEGLTNLNTRRALGLSSPAAFALLR